MCLDALDTNLKYCHIFVLTRWYLNIVHILGEVLCDTVKHVEIVQCSILFSQFSSFLVKIFKTLSLDFFLKRKYTLEYYNFLLTITVPTNQPSLPLSSSSLTLVTTILLSRKVDDFFYLHIQLKLHSSLLPFASLISLNVIISILMEAGFFSWLNSMHVSVSLLIITNWWKYRYSWPLWIVLQ